MISKRKEWMVSAQYNVSILKVSRRRLNTGKRRTQDRFTLTLNPLPTGIHPCQANADSSPPDLHKALHGQCRLLGLFPDGFNLRFYLFHLFGVAAPLVVRDLGFKLADLLGVLPASDRGLKRIG